MHISTSPLHQRIDHMPAPFPTKLIHGDYSPPLLLQHAKTIDDYEELRKMASACDPEMIKGG
jgi:hypothetical protein